MPDTPDTPEEFQAVTMELADKIDRQGQDLGRRDAQIEAMERRIHQLNEQLQVEIVLRQDAEAGLVIACRKADEAQGNFLLADKARAEATRTLRLLETENAKLREQMTEMAGRRVR